MGKQHLIRRLKERKNTILTFYLNFGFGTKQRQKKILFIHFIFRYRFIIFWALWNFKKNGELIEIKLDHLKLSALLMMEADMYKPI